MNTQIQQTRGYKHIYACPNCKSTAVFTSLEEKVGKEFVTGCPDCNAIVAHRWLRSKKEVAP